MTLDLSRSNSLITASDCAANASFNSIIPICSNVILALFKDLRVASTGPIPIISGEHPDTAVLKILANGFRLLFFANSSEQIRTKAAPSVRGDDVPAVTVPLESKAGFNLESVSELVCGRMHPSNSIIPFFVFMGMISSLNNPDSLDSAALF